LPLAFLVGILGHLELLDVSVSKVGSPELAPAVHVPVSVVLDTVVYQILLVEPCDGVPGALGHLVEDTDYL